MSQNINSFVNNNEAVALKEMIFKRARERAQALNEDVQDDVMDMARESFVSKNNPFTNIVARSAETATEEPKEEIGFPTKNLKPVQERPAQDKIINEQLSCSIVKNNMLEAREALSNKKGFVGALNFLNAQAAVSLARTRTDKFEVIA